LTVQQKYTAHTRRAIPKATLKLFAFPKESRHPSRILPKLPAKLISTLTFLLVLFFFRHNPSSESSRSQWIFHHRSFCFCSLSRLRAAHSSSRCPRRRLQLGHSGQRLLLSYAFLRTCRWRQRHSSDQ